MKRYAYFVLLAAVTAVLAGCPSVDTDGDGVPDQVDGCPLDSAKIEPGECGCGVDESTCRSDPNEPTPAVQPSGTPEDDDSSSVADTTELTVAGDWVKDVENGDTFSFADDGYLTLITTPGLNVLERTALAGSEPAPDCEILLVTEEVPTGQDTRVLQYICRGDGGAGINNVYMLVEGLMQLDPITNSVGYREVSLTRILMEVTVAGQSTFLEVTGQIDVTFVGEMAADGRRIQWISATGTIEYDGDSSYSGLQVPNRSIEITDDNWRLHYHLHDFRRPA